MSLNHDPNTNERIAMSFTRMFSEGPLVSLRGSPTVSPTTAALWISLPFLTTSYQVFIFPPQMYFLALSQAPPVLAALIASCTPLTNDPGSNPATALGPNAIPTNRGVNITKHPGAIISLRDSLVEILMHALQSGQTSLVRIPGFQLICLLIYSTMPRAAFPTDFIVKALKAQGNMAPMSRPAKTMLSVRERGQSFLSRSQLCKNPPQRAKETKAADPIAKPLPMAAVVLPAASNASVLFLTSSPIQHIQAIPPALSEIGPYPSIARQIGRLLNIPKAERATPQYPRRQLDALAVKAIAITGMTVERQPRASPQIILVAAPDLHDQESSLTGKQVCEVMYQVNQPMIIPAQSPASQETQAFQDWTIQSPNLNQFGSTRKATASPPVKRIVETISWTFKVNQILLSQSTVITNMAMTLVKMQAIMPTPLDNSGSIRQSILDPVASIAARISLLITKAAQVDQAKEPNRSAPMPAMSPTLSPTLSAIVAGFIGLSSASPFSTFPTRSAPTSAALVQIPPPTLPKRATVDPPSPYPAIAQKIIFMAQDLLFESGVVQSQWIDLKMSTKTKRTASEMETRAKPITQPALQAVLKPQAKDLLAVKVVLQLEQVAMIIPTAPQSMEVIAPIKKQIAEEMLITNRITTNMIMTKIPHTKYSFLRNYCAPSAILAPILAIQFTLFQSQARALYSSEEAFISILQRECQLKRAHRRPAPQAAKIMAVEAPKVREVESSDISTQDILRLIIRADLITKTIYADFMGFRWRDIGCHLALFSGSCLSPWLFSGG